MPRKKKSGSSENHRLSSVSINKDKPIQRNAANARERARMRVLSRAFCRLKTTLPWVPADTKLSKLDTLRLAASYIAHLKGILRDEPFSGSEDSSIHPAMNLTWPFGFNRGGGNGSGEGGSGSEDAESGSSCAWEVAKDCVHLEEDGEEDEEEIGEQISSLHHHHHLQHHLNNSTNILPSYHHHNHPSANAMIPPPCFHDDIMSIG